MVIKTNGPFRISGNNYEEIGPHDDWDFELLIDGDPVAMPFKLLQGETYTAMPRAFSGSLIAILLVERD